MNPSTSQELMDAYAGDTTYKSKPTNMPTGVAPLDTLPAAWWNWLWDNIIKNNNGSYLSLGNVRDELINLITEAEMTPSELTDNQVTNAVKFLSKIAATASERGAVLSSSQLKSVSVDSDGHMTVNALSDWEGTDTVQEWRATIEDDIASLDTSLDGIDATIELKLTKYGRVFYGTVAAGALPAIQPSSTAPLNNGDSWGDTVLVDKPATWRVGDVVILQLQFSNKPNWVSDANPIPIDHINVTRASLATASPATVRGNTDISNMTLLEDGSTYGINVQFVVYEIASNGDAIGTIDVVAPQGIIDLATRLRNMEAELGDAISEVSLDKVNEWADARNKGHIATDITVTDFDPSTDKVHYPAGAMVSISSSSTLVGATNVAKYVAMTDFFVAPVTVSGVTANLSLFGRFVGYMPGSSSMIEDEFINLDTGVTTAAAFALKVKVEI